MSIHPPLRSGTRIAAVTLWSVVALWFGSGVEAHGAIDHPTQVGAISGLSALVPLARQPIWIARYAPGSGSSPYAMKASPDGRTIFVTGSSGVDYATVAYDAASGDQLWIARYHEPSGGVSSAIALGVSPNSRFVYVTGSSDGGPTNDDYVTIGYDAATGEQMWLQRYNGPNDAVDTATSLGVSPAGTAVYVTGLSEVAGRKDFVTFAYDGLTGDVLWQFRYRAAIDIAFDSVVVAASPDGARVFVAGGAQRGDVGNYHVDYLTVSYRALDGVPEWRAWFDGSSDLDDLPLAIATSPDGGRVFVTGESTVGASWDYATVAYEARSGAQLWISTYGDRDGASDVAYAIGAAPDGQAVYVTGESYQGSARSFDAVTFGYDASSGQQLWMARSGRSGAFDDAAFALAVRSDGSRIYVAGCAGGGYEGGCDVRADLSTWAYAAGDGTELWHAGYTVNPEGTNYGQAIATAPRGSVVYVTGLSDGVGGEPDFATLAYPG